MIDKETARILDYLFLTEELSKELFTVRLIYVDMCGDLIAGIILGQIAYWYSSNTPTTTKLRVLKEGKLWLVKRREDWWRECRITPKQVDRALKILKTKGLVEIKRFKFKGVPTQHIRLTSKFVSSLKQIASEGKTDFTQRVISNFTIGEDETTRKVEFHFNEKEKSLTEITTENTTEITERDINRELPREEESEPPKEVNLEKREQAGGGKPFDAVKESQPANSANRLPKQLYISPHAKQIINAFKDQFLTKFGIPPTITTKAVQELEAILSRLSDTEKFAFVQRAAGAIERYLKSEEPFLKKAGYSFQVFVSTMQKYMIEEKKEEKQKSERKDGIIEEMDL